MNTNAIPTDDLQTTMETEWSALLNRRILDTSPTEFLDKLKYKIEEAGGTWVEVPTQKVKPSQACPACGHQEKKKLSDRVHLCAKCGYREDRDRAAARVMLKWADENMAFAA